MNTPSITRRNFIKRTVTTAVAAAFAVGAFESYAFEEKPGSCYCWEISGVAAGQYYNPENNVWPAGNYKKRLFPAIPRLRRSRTTDITTMLTLVITSLMLLETQ